MKNPETSIFVGYVEQGIGGSQDPLSPPISVSRNGSLAKWRGKFHFLDLRLNDPGLRKNREEFSQMIQKASTLGIETIITLPQYAPLYFDLPPEDPEKAANTGRRSSQKRPEKLVYFKPAYLALSQQFAGSVSFHELTVEECMPALELAAEHGVKKAVIPVSEPGQYLDRMAEDKFAERFSKLAEFSAEHGISLHLRNGGLSETLFRKLNNKFKCGLAYNVGIAHLESDNIIDNYSRLKNEITILMLQQVLPGIDRWDARRTMMEKALKSYVTAKKEYRQSLSEGDEVYTEKCLKRFNYALRDYYDAIRNSDCNLGLFQNGDLNLVPLLKEIRKDLDQGMEKYLLLETVPNTKNTDFIFRYLMADSFSGSF
jgi:sugar phosphate isomerase/epimerase